MTKRLIARPIYFVGIMSLYMFLTGCFSSKMTQKTVDRSLKHAPFDAIIVPGVPFEGEQWSQIMQLRVFWSYYLYKNGYTKNVIYSGGAVYTPYTEAKIMALYAEQLGIPRANILEEPLAEHSTENLYYSCKLARREGLERVALATDPFQTAMLRGFARRHKLDVAFLPTVFDTLKTMGMHTPNIAPESAKVDNFVSIVQREDLLQRLRGTLGKNLNKSAYDVKK